MFALHPAVSCVCGLRFRSAPWMGVQTLRFQEIPVGKGEVEKPIVLLWEPDFFAWFYDALLPHVIEELKKWMSGECDWCVVVCWVGVLAFTLTGVLRHDRGKLLVMGLAEMMNLCVTVAENWTAFDGDFSVLDSYVLPVRHYGGTRAWQALFHFAPVAGSDVICVFL